MKDGTRRKIAILGAAAGGLGAAFAFATGSIAGGALLLMSAGVNLKNYRDLRPF